MGNGIAKYLFKAIGIIKSCCAQENLRVISVDLLHFISWMDYVDILLSHLRAGILALKYSVCMCKIFLHRIAIRKCSR